MIVFADFIQKVNVNPKSVIKQLIDNQIGRNGWIFEEDSKYYKGSEFSAGPHSIDEKEEIEKEKYDYIIALQMILKKLEKYEK